MEILECEEPLKLSIAILHRPCHALPRAVSKSHLGLRVLIFSPQFLVVLEFEQVVVQLEDLEAEKFERVVVEPQDCEAVKFEWIHVVGQDDFEVVKFEWVDVAWPDDFEVVKCEWVHVVGPEILEVVVVVLAYGWRIACGAS